MAENTIETNGDIFSIEKFMRDAKFRGDKVLHFNTHGDVIFDMEGFNFAKITDVKLLRDGIVIPLEKTTTWASLLRSVNNALKEGRDNIDVFEECFNGTIYEVVDKYGLGMNKNFSMTLFDDDSFIKSSLYLNNENHALEVWRGKKICAVYTGEVVVVLNALIAASANPDTDEKIELFVSYRKPEVEKNQEIAGYLSTESKNVEVKKNIKDIGNVNSSDLRKQLMEVLEPLNGFYRNSSGSIFQIKIQIDETVNENNLNEDGLKSILEGIKKNLEELSKMV
jgi:hypothetical protein